MNLFTESADSGTGKKKEDKKSKKGKENGSVANNESPVLTELNPPRGVVSVINNVP